MRDAFALLGLDREHAGTAAWNPLGGLVRPGDTVFLKPNMIAHRHILRDEWDSLITHGSVIRAVVDYVHLALKGEGRIWLGDAPQTDSHWDELMARMGLAALREWYRTKHGFDIEVVDLRDEHYVEKDGIYVETVKLPGDPRGSVTVDLANDSAFTAVDRQKRRYYGAFTTGRKPTPTSVPAATSTRSRRARSRPTCSSACPSSRRTRSAGSRST